MAFAKLMDIDKTLTLHNCIDEIPVLADFIEEVCEEAGRGPADVFNLNLALEEAVTNVMLYAYPQEEEHTLCLTAQGDTDSLRFTLTDTGVEFDPTKKEDADVTLSAEERPIGGLGIFLVKQLMDEVSYERRDGTNNLIMTKRFV